MKKVKISPLSMIWAVILLLSETPHILPMLCAVLLHEAGHLAAVKALKIKIKCFHLSILGARIETDGELSYKNEFLLAAAGPTAGLLGFIICIFPARELTEVRFCSQFLLPFAIISLCLTVFNIIPLSTLDGGRMLEALICRLFSLDFATKILKLTSFFTLFAIWIFSVYMLIKIYSGLSMLVFCSVLFAKCFIFNAEN